MAELTQAKLIESFEHLDGRIDDLSKNKASNHQLESLQKQIDEIHLQIAFMNGQLKVLTK